MDYVLVGYVIVFGGILVYGCDYDVVGEFEVFDLEWCEEFGLCY